MLSFLYILVILQYVKSCPVFNFVLFIRDYNTCVQDDMYIFSDENRLKRLLWPGGKLFFKSDGTINRETENVIFEAMDVLEEYTCIKFYEYESILNGNYYITFTSNQMYKEMNFVGLQSDSMYVYVDPKDTKLGNVFHKFLNILGVINEHNRPDRNKYLVVKWGNIISDYVPLFNINEEDYINVGLPYDYGSVTHYKVDEYAMRRRSKTLIPKTKGAYTIIGQKNYVSSLDVAKLNRIYRCTNKYTATDRYPLREY